MPTTQLISPFLWFDTQAEEAANFYTSVFPNSKITNVSRYPEAGKDVHGKQEGSVLTVDFELDGQQFTALNGGPQFKFTEAISLMIHCETQDEVDRYWEKLGTGGGGEDGPCGWLKDKYGVSWQVVPNAMLEFLQGPDKEKSERAFAAMMQMKKLDVAELKRAYDG